MWMKCDTFCAIMQPFVDQHLDKLLGLSNPTIWTSFRAVPDLLLLTEVQDFDDPPDHSVLMITTDSHGEKYFFDGTIDQYGWDWRTNWLMTEKELMESHIDLSQVPCFQDDDFEDVKATRAVAMGMDNEYGYWAIASRRMEQIFRQIDWDALRGCAEGEIEERIRLLSRASFAGAFEETMAQQDTSL
ncbi:hypothetical protein ACET3X_000368 [Alternaria dauci]|uniref:Uncharacterized protein n=1 Tax=Alternaria dauci TaxID=48095 RepID=A0ABR3UU91_9PLEO